MAGANRDVNADRGPPPDKWVANPDGDWSDLHF